ncbi:tRNA 5-methylaminomethyl-2-thiouridine biosynthesis bifunctional protein MnmC [Pontiella desulfatans]|uniref:tRNA 5-methylaminomethyl-2-thiouridine biosynthesis bifunctional protein MnmC n=2 Tax=Pontiella desulfatans TaxID=2750659 RepID=A0A6C2TZ70_PONDE|nr:tRNA 5-methylaminomethyl-2-thiouridine biosynthesis bifunctional protein MnmC [Pontiella desulfatans]
MQPPYLQYKDYMKQRYGDALFRVPIDFNLGCPNRESDGSGGCTFCNVRGSAAVQTMGKDSVEEQMAEAIRFARDRYGAKKYMAYIQAFSATFGKQQQPMYLDLLDAFDFTAVSIGTRPDCLTPQAYDFLAELNKHIEVWVELGVQTVHDRTLERINRGHDWASSETAIQKLHELGINVAVHVILGLPGETAEDFRQTADTLAALPIDAVKIHNLHIEKGTTLALEHALAPLPVLMEHDFAEHLMDFIRRMPPGIPIMRLTTDTLDEELIAPKWHMAKGQFKDYVIQQMTCREWRQGDLFGRGKKEEPESGSGLKTVETDDGSVTFWNEDYKEHYHSPAGARLEAEEKYIVPGKLKERLEKGDLHLLDVCFGLGYNSLCALDATKQDASSTLSITALEMDRRVVGAAAKNIQTSDSDSFDWKQTLAELYKGQASSIPSQASISILWGDARHTITKLPTQYFDLVFLDAFSTQRNSELWTVDFFKKLKAVMKPDAVLLTYCAAIPVRSGLMEAGFFVGETDPVGRQRGGTLAAMRAEDIDLPLPDHELRMIRETTRGLPYRDPYGVRTNKEILRDRQERIIECKQEDSSNR